MVNSVNAYQPQYLWQQLALAQQSMRSQNTTDPASAAAPSMASATASTTPASTASVQATPATFSQLSSSLQSLLLQQQDTGSGPATGSLGGHHHDAGADATDSDSDSDSGIQSLSDLFTQNLAKTAQFDSVNGLAAAG